MLEGEEAENGEVEEDKEAEKVSSLVDNFAPSGIPRRRLLLCMSIVEVEEDLGICLFNQK
jgi:hypothetical protein